MAPHQPLIETLFEEMKGRIKEDESSVPVRDGDWLYWWAFKPGAQYRSWYRRLAGGPDEMLFDEPAEAEGKEYFRLGALEVSPDGKLAAIWSTTTAPSGSRCRIRDLATGKDIETVTESASASGLDQRSDRLVFTEVNENWRSYRARFHRLGDAGRQDVTLYEETEELGFSVGVSRSQDDSLIIIATGDNATSEVRFVPADDPTAPLTLVSPRKEKREYRSTRRTGNCGS